MSSDQWIEHRRADGERIGWLRLDGDAFVAIDLLGRERTGPVDWLVAENVLNDLGLGYLADPYELELSTGSVVAVRIVEVSESLIRLKKEDFGSIGRPTVDYEIPFPAPPVLRSRTTEPR